jgi:hypothetical protein
MAVDDELEKCGRKRSLPVLRHYLNVCLARVMKPTNNVSQDMQSPGRDSNTGPPEYE